ncbi:MAG: methyl-accepting chemotaxis protein [Roseicyclus sp.]
MVKDHVMLATLGISTRIYVGFAVILALLGGLAYYTFSSMTSVTQLFGEYRGTARQTLFLSELGVDVFEGRMAVMKFRETPTPDLAQTVNDHFAHIVSETETVEAFFPNDGDMQSALRALAASASRYAEAFDSAREARGRFDDFLQPMVPLARDGGAAIDRLHEIGLNGADLQLVNLASVAQRDFLLARNHTTKFIERDDPAELAAAKERLSATLETLGQIVREAQGGAQRQVAETAMDAIADYATRLGGLAAQSEQLRELNRSVLDSVGPEMTRDYARLTEQIVERQNTLGPAASARISNTRSVSVWLGIGAVVLGIALAFLIGRWIAGAVRDMAAAMSRMAGGDLDIAVTGEHYKHELGAMARALKVFQTNGREKLRLDAEARAAAEAEAAAAKERAKLQSDVAVVVDRAAAGDFKARVEARYSDEALNTFAKQLNSLVAAVAEGIGETARVMAALAQGNLTVKMQGEFQGAFAELQQNVNTTVEQLSTTVISIQQVSGEVGTATGQISEGAENLSQRAENQAASLEEIAATMEQMSATVKTNAENAYSASTLSGEASSRADKGGAIVAEAVTAMASIEEGSRKIADIVTVIDGFAFQTNLLALNAAVEAARAGEAGKGFAVVASEVRTLAQRSAEAARDIKNLIQESSHQVGDGVRLVEETGTALKEIVEAIRKVSATVTEISEASREQSSGVDEITAAITSMDEITQQNSALADESAAAAKGLTDQAARLSAMMRFFNVRSTAHAKGRTPNAWDEDAKADAAAAKAARHAEAV